MTRRATDAATKAAIRLRAARLRPTRQRIELVGLIFGHGHCHMTAESLHDNALGAGVQVSLATVYNTLHQFTEAGLLRQVVVDAQRSYFDTNTDEHQHFFVQDSAELIDIPAQHISIDGVPEPPKGMSVDRIDVVIRVKRI